MPRLGGYGQLLAAIDGSENEPQASVAPRVAAYVPGGSCHTRMVPTAAGDFELTMDELRAVTQFALSCAEPTLALFERACPGDARPAQALEAARLFVDGAARSRLQRVAGPAAYRAGREAPTDAANHAAIAAGAAAASAYLHPLGNATQVRHILASAAHSARAGELSRDENPAVAEYMLDAAANRMSAVALDVLRRYPRAPQGRTRVAVLMCRLDSLLRDPKPEPRLVDDPGPFFHGTRAELTVGDLLTPGRMMNYGSGKSSRHIYFTAMSSGAALAAAVARGDGPPRVYRVEPVGTIRDDPNVTDKRFPGNPTRSYRTTGALRIVEELDSFEPADPEIVARIRDNSGSLRELGIEAMD